MPHAFSFRICSTTKLVVVKVDFMNAFNSTRHDKMLCAVEEFITNLLLFVHSVYSSPTFLLLGKNEVMMSSEGVQQGDPLGIHFYSASPYISCATR